MPLSAFLRYLRLPLRTAPVIFIAIFSVLFALGVTGGIFSLFLLIVTVSWFFKYSFVMLDDVLNGKSEPPVLSSEMVNPVEQRPLGMLLVLIGVYFLTSKAGSIIGAAGVFALRVVFLCAVPAMIAAMSMSGRFFSGLNPLAVFGIIARIPLAYAGLLLSIALLWFVPSLTLYLLRVTPPLVLGTMLFMYLWLAMMACVGGLMYERRNDLGIEVAHSPEKAAARAQADLEHDRDKEWDVIAAQLRGGAFANAGAEVRRIVASAERPLEEIQWLHERASLLADRKLAEYLVQFGLPRLLEARANGQALDMVRNRLRINPAFRPSPGSLLLSIAALARDAGDRRTARTLLEDFDQRFPNDTSEAMARKLLSDLSRE